MIFAFFPSMPGGMELLIVGLIALLLFGTRLPGIARALGSTIVEFKRGTRDIANEAKGVQLELDQAAREVKEVTRL